MDIEKGEDYVKKADGILSALTKLLKKHWLLIIILLIVWFFYWALTLPDEELYQDEYNQPGLYDESYDDDYYEEPYDDDNYYYEEE